MVLKFYNFLKFGLWFYFLVCVHFSGKFIFYYLSIRLMTSTHLIGCFNSPCFISSVAIMLNFIGVLNFILGLLIENGPKNRVYPKYRNTLESYFNHLKLLIEKFILFGHIYSNSQLHKIKLSLRNTVCIQSESVQIT